MDVNDVSPALRMHLGPEATVALLATFDSTRQEWAAEVTTLAVEHFERRLSHEADTLRLVMHDLETMLRTETRQTRTAVREEISVERTELFKWAVLFWLAQLVGTAAVIVAVM